MKSKISTIMLPGLALIILSSFTLMQNPQDPPKKTKKERHIKMIKVNDNGEKTAIDTVIEGDAPFVWEGDTIGGKEFTWISRGDFAMDSMHQFDLNIQGDGKGMIFMRKRNDCEDFMIPPVPNAPGVMMLNHGRNKNVIDLSDPGIISYDKKLRKDGTEKITIIRNQVSEEDEMDTHFFMDAPDAIPPIDCPRHTKKVKVIKSGDGNFQVFEDDQVVDPENENGVKKFISKDGKTIYIKEKKTGDEKEIEVEVEVNDDENENE